MSILKLKPGFKDYIWGGRRLIHEYGKEYQGEVLAESWELSCHADGPSYIGNGEYAGKTLQEYIDICGRDVLGTNCRRFRDFPILIKFIDAKDNLSIQVHPDNSYALKNEGQYGKTEMWYVMDAKEGAYLYYGFKKEISREEFAERIRKDTLLEVLNAVPVKKGDVLFIESGTIHAIGKDILIAEIQQNSNVTYRVYDYGRVGRDGKKRDLHIEKALAVTNRVPIKRDGSGYPHVADCDYFTVDKLNLDGKTMQKMEGNVSGESFESLLILDGCGTISDDTETLPFKKGDSILLTAGSGKYRVQGVCDALITTIREKAAPVRIGIDIGGTDTMIGLVDVHNRLIASKVIATNVGRPPEEIIAEIGSCAAALLEQEKIPMDQCVGAGIGVPGTVDVKRGIVRYSNNISWENVELAKQIETCLPIPVKIANNADCAALGEVAAGSGRDYKDAVMLTLGTGVGGSVIMDGHIYENGRMGGSELGHMVIVADGEPCTCGRKGCLEAYASATALKREAKRASGLDLSPDEIFTKAAEGDKILADVTENYIKKLGTGIVNIVNIFRPQIIILGGGIIAQEESLLTPLRRMMKEMCFGGEKGDIPELCTALLGKNAGMTGAANLF